MKTFVFEASLFLPKTPAEIFPFFSDALNLQAITPPWVHFEVLTPRPIEMRSGTRLHYKLRLRGIPVLWESEITVWDPPSRFVDEQRRGPYRLWRHEHRFAAREGGTECADHVEYAVLGGSLVNALFVAPELRKIFAYRQAKLAEILGARN